MCYLQSGFDNYLITLSWGETKVILFGKQTLDRKLWAVSLLKKKIYKISGNANADLRIVSQRLKELMYKILQNNAVNIIKQTQFIHKRWKTNVFFIGQQCIIIHMMALYFLDIRSSFGPQQNKKLTASSSQFRQREEQQCNKNLCDDQKRFIYRLLTRHAVCLCGW